MQESTSEGKHPSSTQASQPAGSDSETHQQMWCNRCPETKKEFTNVENIEKVENQRKLNVQKIYVNKSLCPKYKQLLGKCNLLFKRGECIGFYTLNGKIKVKINEDQTKIINRDVDLIQHFGETMTQHAIELERDSWRSLLNLWWHSAFAIMDLP